MGPYWCVVISIVAATVSFAAQAQEELDRTPQDCVRASSIRSTQIVDDKTILFYMSGNRVYRNELPDGCPRLAAEGRFSYERRVGQRVGRLCSIDAITVLESFREVPFGATCRLGQFYPITEAELDDILGVPRGPMRVEPVELPEQDDDASTLEADAAAEGNTADE